MQHTGRVGNHQEHNNDMHDTVKSSLWLSPELGVSPLVMAQVKKKKKRMWHFNPNTFKWVWLGK